MLSTVERICIPGAAGGDWNQLTKAMGFRKNRDGNWVLKQPTYQMTVQAPGSNPNQCHLDIIHPVDPTAPGAPIVVALHNWAAINRGWSLYRNDKSVIGVSEYTTRSWEHALDGTSEALVFTTVRKADGTPTLRTQDTSQVLYSVTKTR
ncbi:MAG TPA: hypothetical protein VFE03_10490 [Caulobacteraceae bacterium]|nr:hypothetical protein [Caulobacteraceae bacterium]